MALTSLTWMPTNVLTHDCFKSLTACLVQEIAGTLTACLFLRLSERPLCSVLEEKKKKKGHKLSETNFNLAVPEFWCCGRWVECAWLLLGQRVTVNVIEEDLHRWHFVPHAPFYFIGPRAISSDIKIRNYRQWRQLLEWHNLNWAIR